jgi:mannosyl-3-phosphoglycerate phosphatase
MKKTIIFTDLDGTLLDYSTYSFEKALPALDLLKQKNIPLFICSSKTKSEIEYYRKKLDNIHPFISENGGGIFVPKNYFKHKIQPSKLNVNEDKDYFVITLGAQYSELRKTIKLLQEDGFIIKGFGDMTKEEVAEFTGQSIDEASMAKERDFDEPFIFYGDEKELNVLFDSIKSMKFNHTQGRFYHIIGNSDKGNAVTFLIDLYEKSFGKAFTIALGDNPNDIPMLEEVDYPIIVQQTSGKYDPRINIKNLIKADGVGPDGWNKAILKLLSEQF